MSHRFRGSSTPRSKATVLALVALLATLLGGVPASAAEAQPADEGEAPTLVLYWGEGCANCEAEKEFLAEFRQSHPDLRVQRYEVSRDSANRERFERHLARLDLEASAVPTTVLGQRVWIGFSEPIEADLRANLRRALAGEQVPAGVYGQAAPGTCTTDACALEPESAIDVPVVGRVDLGSHSLVVSTLLIGFVDGINPCSLWVISILLAIVIRTGSRRRVLAIGSVFLLVTATMYALFMAGVYGALSVISHLGAIQAVVAVAAGIVGVVSVKDYFFYKEGLSFTIPDRSKPGIYARMRRVAGERALVPALAATAVLAVGVSLLETPCTAGFPVIWTGLLDANDVPLTGAVLLFVLYMIPFLLDELVIFTAAVVTMRTTKLQERHGRVLKLVAGTTMLALAGAMLLAPEVMESVAGAGIVFLAAGVAAALIHLLASRWIRRRAPA
jgi:cytochrome c biogenesis protein CcdA